MQVQKLNKLHTRASVESKWKIANVAKSSSKFLPFIAKEKNQLWNRFKIFSNISTREAQDWFLQVLAVYAHIFCFFLIT
jgi:hypothetical protein